MSNMVEPTPRSEPQPTVMSEVKNPENLLDLDKYRKQYARLILAANSPLDQTKTKSLLNPGSQISQEEIDSVVSQTQNPEFNHVVGGLSMFERLNAWETVIREKGPDAAKKQWREGLYASIHLRSEQRDLVVKHFLNVNEISEVSADENGTIDKLYDKYCKGESNIDGFIKKALENPDLSKNELEWLAKKLFGKDTSVAVSRIFELQTSFKNDRSRLYQAIFSDLSKLNEPNPEEDALLSRLSEHYIEPKVTQTPAGGAGRPDQSPSTRDWRTLPPPRRGQKFVDSNEKVGEILSNPIPITIRENEPKVDHIRIGFADGSFKDVTLDFFKQNFAAGHLRLISQDPASSPVQQFAQTPPPDQDELPAPTSPPSPEPITPPVTPTPTNQPSETTQDEKDSASSEASIAEETPAAPSPEPIQDQPSDSLESSAPEPTPEVSPPPKDQEPK